MQNTIMKYFEFAHLPAHLQEVSRPIGELAQQMNASLPDGAEKSAGLRKLLEAKDCLVRARLDAPAKDNSQAVSRPPHQMRVIEERIQLDDKIKNLAAFFSTETYKGLDPAEQERLTTQLGAMNEYSDILAQRIVAFNS